MNSREKIKRIFARKNTDRAGLWLGNPTEETLEIYLKALEFKNKNDLFEYLRDDCRWLPIDWVSYKHPDTMDAKSLAAKYGKDLAFVGGIDIQDILVNATPDQVKDEVRRVKDILGPNYIVSPSHEAVLPNVPLDNILAMAEAAKE